MSTVMAYHPITGNILSPHELGFCYVSIWGRRRYLRKLRMKRSTFLDLYLDF